MSSEGIRPESMIGSRSRASLRRIGLPLLYWASLVILIVLFFHKLALGELILARGDTFLYFYPYWDAAAEALKSGRVPLWNPALFMGAPFLANSQVGVFYPLNWPLWWALPTPYAVSASIVLHLIVAASGAFVLARRTLNVPYGAAWLAGLLFGLGGYLTAQVEHVNQLQGLAWLPWLLLAVDGGHRRRLTKALFVSLLFAAQFLAGHTQTVFISGIAALVWLIGRLLSSWRERGAGHWRAAGLYLLPVAAGGLLALLLSAVQLLPTLELTMYSSRQGGLPLNEALSFSLHPLLLGQALLPHLRQSLFTEYVAFLPLTAIVLGFLALWQWRRRPELLSPVLLAGTGFLFALGRFNPFYILLAYLPGFNYFRAPARWLVLYSLGAALLAAYGWHLFSQRKSATVAPWRRPLLAAAAVLAGLVLLHFIAPALATFLPTGAEAPTEAPRLPTLLLWTAEAVLLILAFFWSRRQPPAAYLLPALIVLFLFLTTRSLPYNSPTAPAAYFQRRPPAARLLAFNNCELLPEQCQQPPGRLLSLSDIFFDLGDQAEIESIYGEQLTEQALYDYVIALKQKEIVAPNLPLALGLASMDGFDGGILPLRAYSALMSLVLPPGTNAVDGRLREYLPGVPEARWLDLFNVRFLITDKVGDIARREVFFDLKHPVTIAAGASAEPGYLPEYEATELWLVAGEGSAQAGVVVETAGGAEWRLRPEAIEDGLWRVQFPEVAVARSVQLQAGEVAWHVQGLALVDSRDGTFHTLVPGNYRLIYSGDVKVYENLDVMPRAFVVHDWQWREDATAVIDLLREDSFDPQQMAILEGRGGPPATGLNQDAEARAEIVSYSPERVEVAVETGGPGVLVLGDAFYPGWRAEVDGQEAPIYRANGLFRAVLLSSGEHMVTFTFESSPYRWGRIASVAGIGLWLLLATLVILRRQQPGEG